MWRRPQSLRSCARHPCPATTSCTSTSVSDRFGPGTTTTSITPSAWSVSARPDRTRTRSSPARSPTSSRPAAPIGPFAEDDGAIPLANPTGLDAGQPTVRTTAQIGDGPHGTIEGDGRGDFDFYLIEGGVAGQQLTVDVDAAVDRVGSRLVRGRDRRHGHHRLQRRRSGIRQLRAARPASRRRLPRRRRRIRLAAEQPIRQWQR